MLNKNADRMTYEPATDGETCYVSAYSEESTLCSTAAVDTVLDSRNRAEHQCTNSVLEKPWSMLLFICINKIMLVYSCQVSHTPGHTF